LSREVYDGFDAAIRERETRGDTAETRFVSIDKSDIHRRRNCAGRTAHVTVAFRVPAGLASPATAMAT